MRVTDRGAAMKSGRLIGCVALLALLLAAVAQGSSPPARAASTCSDYSDQAAAQRAADTLDPDHDGIYCVISPIDRA